MGDQIQLGSITVNVSRKDIKNVHLSVHPPAGAVTVSAPRHLDLDTIRVFTLSKLEWIKREQGKIQQQDRETPRVFLERESHYLWGKRYLLTIVEEDRPPRVELSHKAITLIVRPGATKAKRMQVITDWYREQLKESAIPLVKKWHVLMDVAAPDFLVRKMKTKWGSCSPERGTIRLNLELAKKPPQCLEYLVVHELAHFIEPTHNARFIALMNRFLPNWRHHRDLLNRLPVRHEDWKY